MNLKQAKNLMEGCGWEFIRGAYRTRCGDETLKGKIEYCKTCRREIDRMKADAEYFSEFLDNIINEKEWDWRIISKEEITKLKKIIEVLEG